MISRDLHDNSTSSIKDVLFKYGIRALLFLGFLVICILLPLAAIRS